VIPQGITYRQWLEQVSPHTGSGRPAPAPGDPTRAAGGFRAALAAYVDGGDGRAESLMGDLRDACDAAGVPLPDGEESYEQLADLIEAPWQRVEMPAASIQRIRLDGPLGPGSMTFATPTIEIDLFDLGRQAADRFAPVPDRRVREMFQQRRDARGTGSGPDRRPRRMTSR
jgi:hypothetical protein